LGYLHALDARVALMLSDLSDERATMVKQLNRADIPVTAIPLLSLEQGYYFTPDNMEHAIRRYDEWRAWTTRFDLVWAGVGLDIEPAAQFYLQLMGNRWGMLPVMLRRLFDEDRIQRSKRAYGALINRIHADGWTVENYQFPLIADERWAGSTLLQRLLGLVDVRTDREVWMLYTSVLPGIGASLLWLYAAEAEAVGVGSTGGGPDIPSHPQVTALDWNAFSRDLALASQQCDQLLIHSLEGCVQQGFLERLLTFNWDQKQAVPRWVQPAFVIRLMLRGILWASAHFRPLLGAAAVLWILSRRQRPPRLRLPNRQRKTRKGDRAEQGDDR
jgi:hypothetical protein